MKPLIWIITLAAVSLVETVCLHAQEPGPLKVRAAPPQARGAALQAKELDEQAKQAEALAERSQALEAQAKALDEQKQAEEQDEKAAQSIDTTPTPTLPVPRGRHGGTAGGFGIAGVAPAANPFIQRLQPMIGHAAREPSKPLVIRSSNTDAKEQANLEEDLAVMAHIFDKSVDELPGGRPHGFKAAGIDVFFTPGQNPMRCFYLDGYGAVFLLNVSFPLVPPTQKIEKEKTAAVDSAWAEAQEELFGQPSEGRFVPGMEEYSEEKVTKLKESLFESLKNASNIRGVRPDDSITVCVFGGSNSTRAKARGGSKRTLAARDGDTFLWQEAETSGRQTVLTVRVKKADVDAYAKGKLNPEEFQKRAKLMAYSSSAGNAVFGGATGFGGGVGETRF